jgi:hypothetical protein
MSDRIELSHDEERAAHSALAPLLLAVALNREQPGYAIAPIVDAIVEAVNKARAGNDIVARAKAALKPVGVTDDWIVDPDCDTYEWDDGDMWVDVNGAVGGWVAHCQDKPTAEFITAARTLIPELIAEVEELRTEAARAIVEGDWA